MAEVTIDGGTLVVATKGIRKLGTMKFSGCATSRNAVVISLESSDYKRLIIEVNDPQ